MKILSILLLTVIAGSAHAGKNSKDASRKPNSEFYGGLSYEYAQTVGALAKSKGFQNGDGDFELSAKAACPSHKVFSIQCSPPAVDGGVETGYSCGVYCK